MAPCPPNALLSLGSALEPTWARKFLKSLELQFPLHAILPTSWPSGSERRFYDGHDRKVDVWGAVVKKTI